MLATGRQGMTRKGHSAVLTLSRFSQVCRRMVKIAVDLPIWQDEGVPKGTFRSELGGWYILSCSDTVITEWSPALSQPGYKTSSSLSFATRISRLSKHENKNKDWLS